MCTGIALPLDDLPESLVHKDGLSRRVQSGRLAKMHRSGNAFVVETPIDREDVLSIMRWLMRLDAKADGAGETAITLVGAAIGNAIFDATGARIREAPFTPARVKAALAART